MPYGWNPAPQSPVDVYDIGYEETIPVKSGGPPAPFTPPTIRPPGGGGDYGGGGRSRGGDAPYIPPVPWEHPEGDDLLPDDPYKPDETIPPYEEGVIRPKNWDEMSFMEKLKWHLAHFKFDMGGGGLKWLLELLAKGYVGYEILDGLNDDPKKPQGPTGPGGGGGGGGGGGKGGGGYGLGGTTGVGAYQGLNFKPSFLAWQPTNAGAPQFTGGGPSSLYGTPTPTPPAPVTPPKKKKG